MTKLRIGGEVDSDLLLLYCRTIAEADEVEAKLKKQGTFVTVYKRGKKKGEKIEVSIAHPLLRRRDKLREALLRLAQQFGFSPASRSRVRTDDASDTADPFANFLQN